MKGFILAGLAVALGACSTVQLKANERGGDFVYNYGNSAEDINANFVAHCAKYGRRPNVQPNAQYDVWALNRYQFDCVP